MLLICGKAFALGRVSHGKPILICGRQPFFLHHSTMSVPGGRRAVRIESKNSDAEALVSRATQCSECAHMVVPVLCHIYIYICIYIHGDQARIAIFFYTVGTRKEVPQILGNPNPYIQLQNRSFFFIFYVLFQLLLHYWDWDDISL